MEDEAEDDAEDAVETKAAEKEAEVGSALGWARERDDEELAENRLGAFGRPACEGSVELEAEDETATGSRLIAFENEEANRAGLGTDDGAARPPDSDLTRAALDRGATEEDDEEMAGAVTCRVGRVDGGWDGRSDDEGESEEEEEGAIAAVG